MAINRPSALNVSQWLAHASRQLIEYDSASLDAELLLCHVLQCNRARLFAWPNEALSDTQQSDLNTLIARRELGEPIAYILGQREFWSLELDVNKDVLVPRPDTELIVELGLSALDNGFEGPILDAGTGSGAIAIAIAYELKRLAASKSKREVAKPATIATNSTTSTKTKANQPQIIASDLSTVALQLAKQNATKHHLVDISFVRSNWLAAFSDNQFGIIITNPPYLATDDPHLQTKTLQHEPISALVSGSDGLDDIRTIIKDAPRVAKPGCLLLIEHGSTQAADVRSLLSAANYTDVQTHQDMPGLDRVSGGICPHY